MICREFEEALDELLIESTSQSARALDHAKDCPSCRRLYQEWRWLHEQLGRWPLPAPREDFAERIVRSVQPAMMASATSGRLRKRGLRLVAWAVSLAAAIGFFALSLPQNVVPPPAGKELATVEPATDLLPVPATPFEITDTTVGAYQSLVQNVSRTLDLLGPDEAVANVKADPLLEAPPIGDALLGSTGRLAMAGKSVPTAFRPIADSAVGALSFLWKDVPVEEKPSI